MSIFRRQWLSPSPDVVFNPLAIGVAFLVNIGYGGPVAEEQPAPSLMTCPSLHRWPPIGLADETPRRVVIRHVLHSAQGLDTATSERLGSDLAALSKRADDTLFITQFEGKTDDQLQSNGVCLAPALVAGDQLVELVDETIRLGDFACVVLRGALLPLTKVFAGVIDREGFPSALFYLRTPEQLIEVPLRDVLFARKVAAPRQYDGSALLSDADAFVAKWRDRYHLADSMDAVGTSRTAAWVESMVSIFGVLRRQPE